MMGKWERGWSCLLGGHGRPSESPRWTRCVVVHLYETSARSLYWGLLTILPASLQKKHLILTSAVRFSRS